VTLSAQTARVMSLVHDNQVDAALALAEVTVAEAAGATPSEQTALWYAIADARLYGGLTGGALAAAERCLALAVQADAPGWASAALSLRATALARQGRMEPALLDLGRAEAELTECRDDALRGWAHTGLGYCYLEIRLYELAQPHLERAQAIGLSPVPLREAPVLQLMKLVELHIRWADELERVRPYDGSDDDVERHRRHGHAWADRALDKALRLEVTSLVATCRAMELTSRPRDSARDSLPDLVRSFADEDPPHYAGGRAVVGGALARALWSLGRRRQALEIAREAAPYACAVGDWQVGASAQWLVVEMEAKTGVPGARSGRGYAGLLSHVLWQQRLSTLQGAEAALRLERVHRDKELAQQAASEDPLTGVGNRRVLDDTLRALQTEAALRPTIGDAEDAACSLLVVDLDDFKLINDTYGHVVGDEVLRAVAMAIRGVSRAEDVVVRLGGDEFVVLAENLTGEPDALALAGRLRDLVTEPVRDGDHAYEIGASIGRAAAGDLTEPTADTLLATADAAMYAEKTARRSHRDLLEAAPLG
jgi:diguanylate cyclase (GGDEF)-like protein